MENQRLKELAGLITEKKWSGDVKTKWKPSEGTFTGKAGSIVKALMDAPGGAKKAMSRLNFYINRCGDKCENKEELEKAKKMLERKAAEVKENLEAIARRAGIILEKKKEVETEEDPEMDMDGGDEAPKGEEEEETLPKIVKKIAKKAVGKDVEELEDLIMKVYNAGHKDGVKEASADEVKESLVEAVLSELMSMDAMKKQVDPKEMRKRVIAANGNPFGGKKKEEKKDVKEGELTEKHHVKKGKKVTKVGSKADCEAHAEENGGEVVAGAPMTEQELSERHHVKRNGKVTKRGSKAECMDHAEKHGGEVMQGDEMTEEELSEKHHVKKGGKVTKKGSKKECMDHADEFGGQICKGDPDEKMDEELDDTDLEAGLSEDYEQIKHALSKVETNRVGKPCMTPKGKGVITGIVKQPKAGADGKAGPYVHSVTVKMGDNTVHTMPANQVKLFKGKMPSGPMLPKSVSSTAINNADKAVAAKGGKESGTKPSGKSMWKA